MNECWIKDLCTFFCKSTHQEAKTLKSVTMNDCLFILEIFLQELVLYTVHNRVFPTVSCLKYLLSGDNR